MPSWIFAIAAAVGCALVASWVMWRATERSALWAMMAGALLSLVALAGAVVIAWFMTRAAFGP